MRKQVLIVVCIAFTSFLIGTMFRTDYFASGKPPSVWDAINQLQTQVNALTTTVSEQQAQIAELQTQIGILNATKLGTPNYDSGWVLSDGNEIILSHNLGTAEVLVYLVGRNSLSEPVNGPYGVPEDTLKWGSLTTTQITLFGRYGNKYVRVMLWKIL